MFFLSSLESINTPETAPSTRSPKRKAVADDGPVQKRYRILNPSDIFKAKYLQQQKLGQGGYGCVFAGYRRADNLPVSVLHMFLYTHTDTHTHTVRKFNQNVFFVSRRSPSSILTKN